MAHPSKSGATAKDRRKSDKFTKADKVDKAETVDKADEADKVVKSLGLITVTVSPESLRSIVDPAPPVTTKEESPAKQSPATSTTLPAAPPSNHETASDSTPNTPAASGTPAPQPAMGPPAEGPKKKGVKRSAAAINGNGEAQPKVRGKPGPKKKQRL
jgi:hypothetical protein